MPEPTPEHEESGYPSYPRTEQERTDWFREAVGETAFAAVEAESERLGRKLTTEEAAAIVQPTPEPVLDERGVEAAAAETRVEMDRIAHDIAGSGFVAAGNQADRLARAAITAYQSATGDTLTEALRERDELRAVEMLLLDAAEQRAVEDETPPIGPSSSTDEIRAALTEAEHRAERAERRNQLNPQSTEYVQELEHRAERAEKVVEAARECVTECDYGDETKTVIPRRWCLTHQDWSPCAHARLAAALAALDTTDGPEQVTYGNDQVTVTPTDGPGGTG